MLGIVLFAVVAGVLIYRRRERQRREEFESLAYSLGFTFQETDPDLVYMSLLCVRPGTEMYNHPEKFGFKHVNMDWDKTMHLFSRYGDETPTLNFEYARETPWGEGKSSEKIVADYLEIQNKLKMNGLCVR